MKKALTLAMVLVCLVALSITSFAAPFVAYWSMDGSIEEAYNGFKALNPGDYAATEGKFGQAYVKTSDVVAFEDANIPLGANFTVSVWVKSDEADADGGYHVFFAKNPKAQDGHFELYWNPDGKFCCYNTAADGTNLDIRTNNNMMDGQWHNYIIRCEAGEYLLYVDGTFDVSGYFTQVDAAGPIFFGSLVDESLQSMSAVDELFITNTLIPEEDIASLMNDTKGYAAKLTGNAAETPAAPAPAAEEPATAEAPAAVVVAPAAQTADTVIISAAVLLVASAAVVITRKK